MIQNDYQRPLAKTIAKIDRELENLHFWIFPQILFAGIAACGIATDFNEEVASNSEVNSFVQSIEADLNDNSKLDSMTLGDLGYGSFFIDTNLYAALDLRAISREDRIKMHETRFSSYEKNYTAITAQINQETQYQSWDNISRWEFVFEAYQLEVLRDYELGQFDFGVTVKDGRYNCNAGTAGFASVVLDLAKEEYLDAAPLRFIHFGDQKPGHILVGYSNSEGQITKYFVFV